MKGRGVILTPPFTLWLENVAPEISVLVKWTLHVFRMPDAAQWA